MSIKRTTTWTCDYCGTTTDADPSVQPEGWAGVQTYDPPESSEQDGPRAHACGDCAFVLVTEGRIIKADGDELRARILAWIRYGEAVPSDVTTYDREIVHTELRDLIDRSTS